jgi:hypothetical protein
MNLVVDVYLRIGLSVYVCVLLYIFVMLNVMPWNALGLLIGLFFNPKNLIGFLITSGVLIFGWPIHILKLNSINKTIDEIRKDRDSNVKE